MSNSIDKMTDLEKSSRSSTDVEAQEALAVKEAPVATPGQLPAEPTQTSAAPSGPPSFPEGGRDAWLTLIGAWAVMFVTFGYMNAFGVYESYYLSGPLRDHSPSTVAWIGSIQIFFQFSSALISGPLVDILGPKVIIAPSAFALVLAMMLTSLCKKYYQFILCQGVFGGLATGFLYSPAAAIVGHYFHKKRPMAMGIITSGSALGGILYPIMLDQLLNHRKIGFGWTQRVIGFIGLFMGLLATFLIKPRIAPRKGTYFLPGAFKNMAYTLQVLGLVFTLFGVFTPFFFLPSFAQSKGMSVSLSFYLVTILNAGSIVGRLAAGAGGVALGQFNVLFATCAVSTILVWSWLSIESNASIIVFSVFYGASSGGAISTMISTLAACAPHPNQMGTYIGMASGLFGVAGLTGTPINGAFLAHYHGYNEAIYFSGATMILGCILLFGARASFAPLSQVRA